MPTGGGSGCRRSGWPVRLVSSLASFHSLDKISIVSIHDRGGEVEFEFDARKSEANLAKHGINFTQAQVLWQDVLRIEVPARTVDEPRWLVVGVIDGKHWSAVVTYREDRIRIISVRRSRKEEVDIYEG